MKVLHVIPSVSDVHGGPSLAIKWIIKSLGKHGTEVEVLSTDDNGPGNKLSEVEINSYAQNNELVFYCFSKQTEFYKISIPLRNWIRSNVHRYDLVHIHALFSYSSLVAARAAEKAGVPYVIRPLGVLNNWGMQNRRPFIKRLSFEFIEKPILKNAAAIHFTSMAELQEAEQIGCPRGGYIIPLGVDLNSYQSESKTPNIFFDKYPQANGKNLILFLSRLDPKKGLDILLPAFKKVVEENSNVMLVIAGSGDSTFVESLNHQAIALGIQDSIIWTGFVDGAYKKELFSVAKIFVLPSYSENFGVALAEAMAAGLPCVTTFGVAISTDIVNNEAGLVVNHEAEPIASALNRLLNDLNLRVLLGARAQKLSRERYSVEAMGAGLHALYSKILA